MSQKLTPEELQEFRGFRQEATRLASILGELHYQKTLLDLELDNLKASIKANAEKQSEQLKVLGQKYGNGSINLETGDISAIDPA